MGPRIGQAASQLEARQSQGSQKFSLGRGQSWAILSSHGNLNNIYSWPYNRHKADLINACCTSCRVIWHDLYEFLDPLKKKTGVIDFFWKKTEIQTDRGQTMDKPWKDLLGSWNALKGSWKDLLGSWTPPPSESSKIHIFNNPIWYAMFPLFAMVCQQTKLFSIRLQFRVSQKIDIVRPFRSGCSMGARALR